MTMSIRYWFAGTTLAVLAAGCAGNGPGALPQATVEAPPSSFGAVRDHATNATERIRVVIPIVKAAHFFSPSTKGMAAEFAGTKTFRATFPLLATSPGCSKTSTQIVCLEPIALDAGNYNATVELFDQPPASGKFPTNAHLLSWVSKLPMTIKAGLNTTGFALDGVPKTVVVSGLPAANAGTLLPAKAFSVVALDADGNVITGTYASPITLSDNDTHHAITLSTAKLTASTQIVKISYSGLAIEPVKISATAPGATAGSATFSPVLQALGPTSLQNGIPINQHGAANLISFTATEIGWLSSPYNQELTVSDSACTGFVTIAQAPGGLFTATLASGATTSGACTLTLSDPFGHKLTIPVGYSRFSQIGYNQTFGVPAGVTQLTIFAAGAQGGPSSLLNTYQAAGGTVQGTFTVPALYTLNVYVGGSGTAATYPSPGGAGSDDGGTGGVGDTCGAGGGGGSSGVAEGFLPAGPRPGNVRPHHGPPNFIALAGAGGGSSCGTGGGDGGLGGSNTVGGAANAGTAGGGGQGGGGGAGGTISAGGSKGQGCMSGPTGSTGVSLRGGDGGPGTGSDAGGGGGGGGYYGGGGGGVASGSCGPFAGGGGGGSSYLATGVTNALSTQGGNQGDGFVVLTW